MNSLMIIMLLYVVVDEYSSTGELLIIPSGGFNNKIMSIILDVFLLSLIPPILLSVKDLNSTIEESLVTSVSTDEILDFNLNEEQETESQSKLTRFHPLKFWTLIVSTVHFTIGAYMLFSIFIRNRLIISFYSFYEVVFFSFVISLFLSGFFSLLYLYQLSKIKKKYQ